jgi:hypothetical protein
MIRAWAMYNPLRAFVAAGLVVSLLGAAPMIRFVWFYVNGDGGGHVQSLVIGGVLLILGVIAMMLGAVADLIGRNRILMEQTLERLRMLEEMVRDGAAKPVVSAGAARQRRAG